VKIDARKAGSLSGLGADPDGFSRASRDYR
jgi:hypothetical protein